MWHLKCSKYNGLGLIGPNHFSPQTLPLLELEWCRDWELGSGVRWCSSGGSAGIYGGSGCVALRILALSPNPLTLSFPEYRGLVAGTWGSCGDRRGILQASGNIINTRIALAKLWEKNHMARQSGKLSSQPNRVSTSFSLPCESKEEKSTMGF